MMDTRCPRVGLSHVTVTRCQVQSSRCIQSLLAEPRISAKAFSVSAPSVWNKLSYNCRYNKYFSTFTRILKTELFDVLILK